jgi:MFS family permease
MTSEEKQVAVQPGAEDSLRSTPTPVSQTAAAADHDENQQDDAPDLQMTTLQRRIVTFSLCAVQFVAALDITIIATALPTITSTLSASASEYAWIGSSYTLASTALTPIWAKMSDIFGLKPMLILSNSIFMAGSLIAALAVSPGMLIGGRALQGVGAGGILVLVSITVGFLFKLEDRAKYYGIVGMVWAVANALGPVLGGVFSQSVSWRWCCESVPVWPFRSF